MTPEEEIAQFTGWYHRIEVAPGLFTPGVDNTPGKLAILDTLGFPKDCTGLRVLDVGTADGAFAFEAKRRGAATVVAIDTRRPEQTGFWIARNILGIWVDYHQRSVYDLHPSKDHPFDVILFLGVLYHLRHPLLALDRLRQVIDPNGVMLIDTHSIQAGLCDNQLAIDPATSWFTAREVSLWQTFIDHRTPYIGFSPNLAGLDEALYKTQWTMSSQVEFAGSRLYAAARPAVVPAIEKFIAEDGLR